MFHFGLYRPDFRTSQIKKISSDFSKLIKTFLIQIRY